MFTKPSVYLGGKGFNRLGRGGGDMEKRIEIERKINR